LLRLAAGRSEYLRNQVWSALSDQAATRATALSMMTAIATGSETVPTNLPEALAGLPDQIGRNPAEPGAQRAAEILIRAAHLTPVNEALSTPARAGLRDLVGGLTDANNQSRSILQAILAGAVTNDQGATILGSVGSQIASEPVRRQFVDLIRAQLREAPVGDTALQQRLATALSSLINGFAPLRRAQDSSDASAENIITYLGVPSEALLSLARAGDNRAQLELEAYGISAIRYLQPTEAVDRQVFARIAATHLAHEALMDELGLAEGLRNPRRLRNHPRDQSMNHRWNSLLAQFAPSPLHLTLRTGLYDMEQWRAIQTELQGVLVDQVRQQANAGGPSSHRSLSAAALLIAITPPVRPITLVSDRTTNVMEAMDRALTTAVRSALPGLSSDPQRQLQILTQLLERQAREPDNAALLRTTAEVAARITSVPAPVLASLNAWLRYTTERNAPGSSSGSSIRQERYMDALSGAAALIAAGREVDPVVATAARNAVGQLINEFTGTDQSRPLNETLINRLAALAPFMSPEQARTLLESPQAAALGSPRAHRQDGLDTTTGQLQQSFGALVRNLLNSTNRETEAAALQYTGQNWHVVATNLDATARTQLLARVQPLSTSERQRITEALAELTRLYPLSGGTSEAQLSLITSFLAAARVLSPDLPELTQAGQQIEQCISAIRQNPLTANDPRAAVFEQLLALPGHEALRTSLAAALVAPNSGSTESLRRSAWLHMAGMTSSRNEQVRSQAVTAIEAVPLTNRAETNHIREAFGRAGANIPSGTGNAGRASFWTTFQQFLIRTQYDQDTALFREVGNQLWRYSVTSRNR